MAQTNSNDSYLSAVRKRDNQFKFDQPYPELAPQPNIFQGANPYAPAPEAKKEESLSSEGDKEKLDLEPMGKKIEQMGSSGGQKSALGTAASLGGDALILYGDPTMKGVGLGLKAAAGISDAIMGRKRQQEVDEYNAKVAQINARQEALSRLSQIGQGMKA